MKTTLFPVILELINFVLIGNLGGYQDIISYSISLLFINIMGFSFGLGIVDVFDELDVKNNIDFIRDSLNSSLSQYYDSTKLYLFVIYTFLAVFSFFSKGFLNVFNFNDQIINDSSLLIEMSILSNLFYLFNSFNMKVLRISNHSKHCDKLNIISLFIHFFFSFVLIYFLKDKVFALGMSIIISSFFIFLFSSFFVDEYAVIRPPLIRINFSSVTSLGLRFFKKATFYGFRSLINYLFFAVFILLSLNLTEKEFAINSLIGNFMKVILSLAAAISLSYKYYHDYKNSHTFIQQYSTLFYYVVAFILVLVSVVFLLCHSYFAGIYTSDDLITSGVNSVLLLYPFFFLLECLIAIFEQETNIRKKRHKKYNYYGLILNILAIIIFSPIASLMSFYWNFSYGGIWICYFEFLVFKFVVELIVNLFKF
jgi:Na+-driven multidrug efflux pump